MCTWYAKGAAAAPRRTVLPGSPVGNVLLMPAAVALRARRCFRLSPIRQELHSEGSR